MAGPYRQSRAHHGRSNRRLTPATLLVIRQAVPHVEERLLVHRFVLERGVEPFDGQVVVRPDASRATTPRRTRARRRGPRRATATPSTRRCAARRDASRLGIDAALEQLLEPRIHRRSAQAAAQERDHAERRQMPFVEHDRIAQRNRTAVVRRRIDQIEDRLATARGCGDTSRSTDSRSMANVVVSRDVGRYAKPGTRNPRSGYADPALLRKSMPRGAGRATLSDSWTPRLCGRVRAFAAEARACDFPRGSHANGPSDQRLPPASGPCRAPRGAPLALHPGVDHPHQVLRVFVGVLLRIPVGGQVVDQLPRHLQLGGADVAPCAET